MSFYDFQKQINLGWNDYLTRRKYVKMRKASPITGGRCNLCERESETIYPLLIDLCRKCSKHMLELNVKLVQVKRFMRSSATCSFCEYVDHPRPPHRATVWEWNPSLCERCVSRFDPSGRREHKV